MIPPHAQGIDAFTSGELRKSKSTHSLNHVKTTSGGGSGYRSESRKPMTEATKYSFRGNIVPAKVVRTYIHYVHTVIGVGETPTTKEKKTISKLGYIPHIQAFKVMPFTYKVEYKDANGKVMTVTNINIK